MEPGGCPNGLSGQASGERCLFVGVKTCTACQYRAWSIRSRNRRMPGPERSFFRKGTTAERGETAPSMEVTEQIAAGLPFAVDELAGDAAHEVAKLWLLARTYSRLRHKTSARQPWARLEALKIQYVRLALAPKTRLFFVFVDPGMPHLRLVYHRVERNLLHVPVTTNLRQVTS